VIRRVEIQTNTPTRDALNAPINNWATTKTAWAEFISSGSGEFYAAQKINSVTTGVFKIRYRVPITPLNRIKYGSRIFEILGVNDKDEAHEWWIVSVKEVV